MDAFYGAFGSAPMTEFMVILKNFFQKVSFAFGQKEDTFTVCHIETKLPSG